MLVKKKRKRKTKVRFYKLAGLKAQGRKELSFIKECIRYKRELPTKPKRIETPIGYYTPDFEYPDRFIEVKSLHTYKVCLGELSYKNIGIPSDLQWLKIQWVSNNIKPINIIVYLSKREKKPNYTCDLPNITLIFKGGYKPKK